MSNKSFEEPTGCETPTDADKLESETKVKLGSRRLSEMSHKRHTKHGFVYDQTKTFYKAHGINKDRESATGNEKNRKTAAYQERKSSL